MPSENRYGKGSYVLGSGVMASFKDKLLPGKSVHLFFVIFLFFSFSACS
jgi:hypothetical protein